MSDNKQTQDLSIITGGSARKIYDTTQAAIKNGQLPESLSITRTNQFHAPFDFLFVKPGFNIRESLNEEKIELFAQRFQDGLYVPPIEVIAVSGRFQVLDGHHRYYGAAKAIQNGAKIARITLNVFDGDENQAVLRMISSSEGEKLSALEMAGAYLRLKNQGLSVAEIAAARQQSALQITKMLKLANAPLRVKEVVRQDLMTATTAIDILIECEKTGQDAGELVDAALANAAAAGKVRATGKHMKAATNKPKPLPRKHVESAIGSLLGTSFAAQLRSALPADSNEQMDGEVQIKLPASIGRDLLAAFEELEKAKAAQEAAPDSAGE